MIKLKIFSRLCLKFGFFFALNLKLKTLFSKDLISLKLKGYKHKIYLRKGTSDIKVFYQVFLNDEYNFNVDAPPKFIIDAGANIGLASIYFANKFPNSEIVSVEPELNNFNLLNKNTENYKTIKTIKAGIWSHDCELEIKDSGSGEWAFEVFEKISGKGDVKAISIGSILNNEGHNHVDILKIDIEGSEKEVFTKNYDKWISNTKNLIVETHDRMKAGTSKAVFFSFLNYNFECEILGENFLFKNIIKDEQ